MYSTSIEARLSSVEEGSFLSPPTLFGNSSRILVQLRRPKLNTAHNTACSCGALSTIPKQAVLWSAQSHPNISKLVGVREDMKERQFAAVPE